MGKDTNNSMAEESMIQEIIAHLDGETKLGVGRMSVGFDDNAKETKSVDHKCCYMYGKPATETVNLLDMYSDLGSGNPEK